MAEIKGYSPKLFSFKNWRRKKLSNYLNLFMKNALKTTTANTLVEYSSCLEWNSPILFLFGIEMSSVGWVSLYIMNSCIVDFQCILGSELLCTGSRRCLGSVWTQRGFALPSFWIDFSSRWCNSSPCPRAGGGLQTGISPLGLAQWRLR